MLVEHVVGRAKIPASVPVKQQAAIRIAHGEIDIVQAGDDGCTVIGSLAKQTQSIELMLRIEMIGGFVEQVKIGCWVRTCAIASRRRSPPDSVSTSRSSQTHRGRPMSAPRVAMSTSSLDSHCKRPICGWRPIIAVSSTVAGKMSSTCCGNSASWRAMSWRPVVDMSSPLRTYLAVGGGAQAGQRMQCQ